jgi:Uma2 family endonuclease
MFESMLTPDRIAPEKVRPLKRAEYDRLVELGVFEDERVELLQGVLVEMSPQDPGHAYVISQLHQVLDRQVPAGWVVRAQFPLALGDDSEPEPDLAIVPDGDYRRAHPSRAILIIEVAGSSIRKDRELKAALYARAEVDEYWIVDLTNGTVELYREPVDGTYRVREVRGRGQVVTSSRLPALMVPVDDFMP